MKNRRPGEDNEMRPEYDFSQGERGRYAGRYREGTNLVAIAPDLREAFPDSASVNEALRLLVEISSRQRRISKPAG